MIRVRNDKGKVLQLAANVKFVELCDNKGNLALLIHQPAPDVIRYYTQNDPEFQRYIKAYGVKMTEVIMEK